jgi:hypothetical protein
VTGAIFKTCGTYPRRSSHRRSKHFRNGHNSENRLENRAAYAPTRAHFRTRRTAAKSSGAGFRKRALIATTLMDVTSEIRSHLDGQIAAVRAHLDQRELRDFRNCGGRLSAMPSSQLGSHLACIPQRSRCSKLRGLSSQQPRIGCIEALASMGLHRIWTAFVQSTVCACAWHASSADGISPGP